jgi:phospholipid transport system substrate-binding protein
MIRIVWRVVRRGAVTLAAALLLSGLLPGAASAAFGGEQRAFVEALAEKAMGALTNPDLPDVQREAAVGALLEEYFAIPAIGQWVLGRYWRNATPEQRSEYLMLFENMIVVTYTDRFKRYSGQTLTVINVSGEDESNGDVVVQSELDGPGAAEAVSVGWRVRLAESAMKIVDVIVEGVSMGQTQRSEFGSIISRSGGDILPLLEQMQRVVAQRS